MFFTDFRKKPNIRWSTVRQAHRDKMVHSPSLTNRVYGTDARVRDRKGGRQQRPVRSTEPLHSPTPALCGP